MCDNWNEDEDQDDLEGPQSVDLDDLGHDDESDTRPCPHCGQEIYEDAEQCPYCGQNVVWGTASYSRSWLFLLVLAIILVAFLVAVLRWFF